VGDVNAKEESKSKRFFFEKKNQKTFAKWAPGVSAARAQFAKFFLLLFCSQKRRSFFLFPLLFIQNHAVKPPPRRDQSGSIN
jgi:hypothetical protein